MKIKKLTDNKIQVIINFNEIEQKNINTFIYSLINEQKIFLDILLRAEKEVNFNTDGCKLLIEGYFNIDNFLIFTITKYNTLSNIENITKSPKTLNIKRKNLTKFNKNIIYSFDNFNTYYDFSKMISHYKNLNLKDFSNNITLYKYKNIYYLIIKNITYNLTKFNIFTSNISEFAKSKKYTPLFESKLLEHGEILIRKNALNTLN